MRPSEQNIVSSHASRSEGVRIEGAWPIMVKAHNEAKRIVACLDSIFASDPDRKLNVFVMANGCTDSTEDVVREYGKKQLGVNVVSIKMGDYCNAWNVFIHHVVPRYAPDSEVYFFMDGDCRVFPGSLSELARGLAENEDANAAGSIPMSGRSQSEDARTMIEGRSFYANLYALKGRFVRDLQKKNARLPVKLEGDDGLIGAFVKWNLDPRQDFDDRRVIPCPKAGFTFDPVSPFDIHAWRPYLRRLIRYGRRRYEFELLGPKLKEEGLGALPEHISEIYGDANNLKLRRQGIYTITNWIALRQLRKYST
jgi:glycosyltransferase involved in cell wall biosynthesis